MISIFWGAVGKRREEWGDKQRKCLRCVILSDHHREKDNFATINLFIFSQPQPNQAHKKRGSLSLLLSTLSLLFDSRFCAVPLLINLYVGNERRDLTLCRGKGRKSFLFLNEYHILLCYFDALFWPLLPAFAGFPPLISSDGEFFIVNVGRKNVAPKKQAQEKNLKKFLFRFLFFSKEIYHFFSLFSRSLVRFHLFTAILLHNFT